LEHYADKIIEKWINYFVYHKDKMKIRVQYDTSSEERLLKIEAAKHLGDYAIRIIFDDGVERLVDFKPFLTSSVHPSVRKYLNEDLFSKFCITDGNLNWNDYDLIFPIWDLYNGRVDA
jgi:hypothetical protein